MTRSKKFFLLFLSLVLLFISPINTLAFKDGDVIEYNSPEGGAATSFLFTLPFDITELEEGKDYKYRIEYGHFLESKAPCYNIWCIGKEQKDNQWLVVAADNSKIYRNPGNGTVGESAMNLIFPSYPLRKIMNEKDAINHLQEYLTINKKTGANYALQLDPNSRADGPGTWSIEISLGENHPDHFVTLSHYRVLNNGIIEELNMVLNAYVRVN